LLNLATPMRMGSRTMFFITSCSFRYINDTGTFYL
jgi:hypothetical protein